jgi:phytoene desaturase
MTRKTAIVIGSGLGGLGTACLLAKAGYQVTVLEKNDQLGGRAGLLEAEGFRFDMGPSWYLMPDIFERFFELLGEKVNDHLDLVPLSPSYRVFYKDSTATLDIYGDLVRDKATFTTIEPGAGDQLQRYVDTASYLYKTSIDSLLFRDYQHVGDMFRWDILRQAPKLKIFQNLHHYVAKHFRDQHLQQIMEYPAVFLGSSPYRTPAFYSLLSHALFRQGVLYPRGGIYKLVEALAAIGRTQGVQYRTNAEVQHIEVDGGKAVGVRVDSQFLPADIVISNADPHHTDTQLLAPADRDYSADYWQHRVVAPSALLLYLGVNRQYPSLQHHNLLFSRDWQANFAQIFDYPRFPTDPSLYVCAPSKTDPTVAPPSHENLFVLVPIAAGLDYTQDQLETYADQVLAAIETHMQLPNLRQHLVYKKLFCVKDFSERLHSFRGTGLGLAHTLLQTASFRPHNKSRKVQNLYHVGGNVHPGIGMPSTLISAELVVRQVCTDTKK